MKAPEYHTNSLGFSVFGKELESGDVLLAEDLYESSNGRWEKCPCPGLTLQVGANVKWVRIV